MSEQDSLTAAQQQFEQASTALTNFAVILSDYFKKLRSEGFTRDEAMELVVEYQTQMFGKMQGNTE